MSVRQIATNNKGALYQITSEATDLGTGAAITPALVSGFTGASVLGFSNPAGNYNSAFNDGDQIIAEDTGRFWRVGRDTSNVKVLVLETSGSGNAGIGADIVYVVAQSAKYGTLPMSSFVFTSLTAAITAAAAVGGATIMLLDDTYSAGATISLPNNTRLTGLSGNPSAVALTTSLFLSSSVFSVPAGATVSLSNLTVLPVASDQAIACLGAANVRLDNVRIPSGNGSFIGVGGITTLIADRTLFGSAPTSISMTVGGSSAVLTDCSCTGSVAVTGAATTLTATNTSVTGTTSAQDMTSTTCTFYSDVTVAGVLTENGSYFGASVSCGNNSTLRNTLCNNTVAGGDTVSLFGVYAIATITLGPNASVRDCTSGTVSLGANGSYFNSTAMSTFTASSVLCYQSMHRGRLNLSGACTLYDITATVTGLAAGVGAIVLAAGASLTVSGLVRGDQTFSISGDPTATVTIDGQLLGGCFINNVAVLRTRSSVSGKRVATATMGLAIQQDIQTWTGVTDVVDVVRMDPTTAGSTLQVYDPARLPDGFVLTLRNVAYTLLFSVNVAAPVGVTIDGSALPIAVNVNGVLNLVKVSDTAWETL